MGVGTQVGQLNRRKAGKSLISVQSPNTDGKELLPLTIVFWEDGKISCGVRDIKESLRSR